MNALPSSPLQAHTEKNILHMPICMSGGLWRAHSINKTVKVPSAASQSYTLSPYTFLCFKQRLKCVMSTKAGTPFQTESVDDCMSQCHRLRTIELIGRMVNHLNGHRICMSVVFTSVQSNEHQSHTIPCQSERVSCVYKSQVSSMRGLVCILSAVHARDCP